MSVGVVQLNPPRAAPTGRHRPRQSCRITRLQYRPLPTGREVVEHVCHAARAAREVEREDRAHQRPAQSWTIGNRRIGIGVIRAVPGKIDQRADPARTDEFSDSRAPPR